MSQVNPAITAAIKKILERNTPKISENLSGITGKELQVMHKGKQIRIPIITNQLIQTSLGRFQ